MRNVVAQERCIEYFDGYIEEVEYDSDIFRDSAAPKSSVTKKQIAPELLWYLGHQTVSDQQSDINQGQLAGTGDASPVIIRAKTIGQLLEKDSHQAQTQTEPGDFPNSS